MGLVIYVLCVLAFSVFLYRESAQSIRKQADADLYNAAVTLPLMLGEEELTRLAQGRVTTEEYLEAVKRMSQFSSIWNVSSVFHLRERPQGLTTTVGSVNVEDLKSGYIPRFEEEPTQFTPSMLETLRSGKPIYTVLQRADERFRTVLVPLADGQGRYHYSGADRPLKEIDALVRGEALRFSGYGLLFLIFAVPLVGLTFMSLRSVLFELRRNCVNLTKLSDRYKELSYVDMLTGLPNRRAFFENANRVVATTLRKHRPLHVLTLDIDHFKNVNDSYGHIGGDRVLIAFAGLLQDTFRRGDIVGRCGGEEFGVILPDSTFEGALQSAERLREACAEFPFSVTDESIIRVTVSIGLAALDMDQGGEWRVEEALHQALRQSDAALYRAKRLGRNRVCVFDPEDFVEVGDHLPGGETGIAGVNASMDGGTPEAELAAPAPAPHKA